MITLFFLFATALLIAALMMPTKHQEPVFHDADWVNGRDPVFIRKIGADYMDSVYGKAVAIK